MARLTCTLVGMHFRPPAKAILANLPAGAQLDLVPEPDNMYDEHAVKVVVDPGEVPSTQYEELDNAMAGQGHDSAEFLKGPPFHLGYIGSKPGRKGPMPGITYAPDLAPVLAQADDYKAELGFDLSGDPIVYVTIMAHE